MKLVADRSNKFLTALFADNTVEFYDISSGRSLRTMKNVREAYAVQNIGIHVGTLQDIRDRPVWKLHGKMLRITFGP